MYLFGTSKSVLSPQHGAILSILFVFFHLLIVRTFDMAIHAYDVATRWLRGGPKWLQIGPQYSQDGPRRPRGGFQKAVWTGNLFYFFCYATRDASEHGRLDVFASLFCTFVGFWLLHRPFLQPPRHGNCFLDGRIRLPFGSTMRTWTFENGAPAQALCDF